MLAHRGSTVMQRVQYAYGEGFIRHRDDFLGTGPVEAGHLIVRRQLTRNGRTAEHEGDDASASAWLSAGVDIRTVAEYLGHGDPGFTLQTYAHLMPDATDRARKAMNVFFAGKIDKPSALDVPSEGSG